MDRFVKFLVFVLCFFVLAPVVALVVWVFVGLATNYLFALVDFIYGC